MATISQTTFSNVSFFNEIVEISLKFVLKGPIDNIPFLDSDNALVPKGRQAIIWTNDGLCCRRVIASLSLNELTK